MKMTRKNTISAMIECAKILDAQAVPLEGRKIYIPEGQLKRYRKFVNTDKIRSKKLGSAAPVRKVMSKTVTIGKDADGIRVQRGTRRLYHICCECGARHRIAFVWPRGAVIMKWERVRGQTT